MTHSPQPVARRGRPRSDRVERAILDAAREILVTDGFAALKLEHVASRAGVGKTAIYRRWGSKEALSLAVLEELGAPHIRIAETGNTRAELLAATTNAMTAVVDTDFGPVIEALMSQIAMNPEIGDPSGRRSSRAVATRSGEPLPVGSPGATCARMRMSRSQRSCWSGRCTSG